MTTKATLYRLIDGLSECLYEEAERYLTGLTTEDPVLRAFLLAPLDDEPETEEERLGVEEAKAELARGEGVPWEAYQTERRARA